MANNNRGIFDSNRVKRLIKSDSIISGLDKLVYEYIRDAIKKATVVTPIYNPYLYESLLGDSARLLDRCLAYRKECTELEAQAVRRALEFELVEDLFPEQQTLQRLLTATDGIEKQREASSAAAAALKDGMEKLEKGFAALYTKTAQGFHEQENIENNKRTTLLNILNRTREHQKLLQARHMTPGHALNYMERRRNIIPLITQDIVEAYQKARAAKAGLKEQLGVESDVAYPFPAISDDEKDVDFLDNLVLWTRSVVVNYEMRARDDVSFVVVVPLVFPWAINAGTPRSLKTPGEFNAAMIGDGSITFNLKDVLPTEAQVKRLRVRSVGVSVAFGNATNLDSNLVSTSNRTWSCQVFAPGQPDAVVDGRTINRSPVVLGRVLLDRSDVSPEMVSGQECWNVDPRAGDWTVVVGKLSLYPSDTHPDTWPRANSVIKDLRLHLRLIGQPSKIPGDWALALLDKAEGMRANA